MWLYRLELAFFDEPQDCGFLQGLDDIGLSEESTKVLLEPFEDLPCPVCAESVSFWFTEAGLQQFSRGICAIQEAIEPLGWTIYGAKYNTDDEDNAVIVYSDQYQVAFPQEWIKNLMIQYNTPWHEFISNFQKGELKDGCPRL